MLYKSTIRLPGLASLRSTAITSWGRVASRGHSPEKIFFFLHGASPPLNAPKVSNVNTLSPRHFIPIPKCYKTFGTTVSTEQSWFVGVMGQVLDKLQGKESRQRQIRRITDRVFDAVKNESGRANLKFEDLYIAVLIVYNDINKLFPITHVDPPSKERVKDIMKSCDINFDGEIDREEFYYFIKKMTADTFTVVSQELIVTLVATPIVAVATKKATERVPGIGKVVQSLPNSVYASLVTLAAVWFLKLGKDSENFSWLIKCFRQNGTILVIVSVVLLLAVCMLVI